MHANLTPRQRGFVELAGVLADRFAPQVDADDRAGRFPIERYAELRDSGYLRMIVPRAYGGDEADLYEVVLAQERLARGDGATAMAVDMTLHLIGRLRETQSWPEAIFAEVCRDVAERGALINSAATEPEMGSPSRGGLPATTATPTDGGWLLNGRKQFVSMAPALTYIVTSVALPAGLDAPNGATANALVRAGADGLRLEDTWGDALSLRTSGSFDIVYENVFVPDAWLIERKPLGGGAPAAEASAKPVPPAGNAWFGLTLAAVYLGIGQAAVDAACAYARERVPSALGRPIATLPAIQGRIGEAQVALMAARSVLHDTARAWADYAEQRVDLGPQIAAAKYLCTNAAQSATDQALRVAGGFGLTRRLPLERLYRDARAGLTHPPQDEPALEMVGRAALARS
jgi:alkylation response protein AidB-like acyl-CoA dehydrogenase